MIGDGPGSVVLASESSLRAPIRDPDWQTPQKAIFKLRTRKTETSGAATPASFGHPPSLLSSSEASHFAGVSGVLKNPCRRPENTGHHTSSTATDTPYTPQKSKS